MSRARIVLVGVLVATAVSLALLGFARSGAPSGNAASFAAWLRQVRYGYEPVASPRALRDIASLTLLGRIEGVEPGRVIVPLGRQITLRVAVIEVLHGGAPPERGMIVDVEIPAVAGPDVRAYREAASPGRLVLFLDDRTHVPSLDSSTDPIGRRIYTPYAQGVVIEDGARYIGGFDDLADMDPDWTEAPSFDAFVEELRR